jgi:hypothetical protein
MVSFDSWATTNADLFAQREVQSKFNAEKLARGEPQLLLIASDGELYGHHKTFRDHFLAHLVNGASSRIGISNMFPSLWLKSNPPSRAISIRENTSWSCHHGVMRWKGECACTPEYGSWKAYLRRAFDRLAAAMDLVYLNALKTVIANPWALRDEYIHVMLGRLTAEELISQAAGKRLPGEDWWRIYLLLEAQRERQRIFTSCGWYFDDFSRIEPRNNVVYAARAVRLVRLATGIDLAPQIISDLSHVISQRTGQRGDITFRRQLHRVETRIRN